jgi:hypothetical protein
MPHGPAAFALPSDFLRGRLDRLPQPFAFVHMHLGLHLLSELLRFAHGDGEHLTPHYQTGTRNVDAVRAGRFGHSLGRRPMTVPSASASLAILGHSQGWFKPRKIFSQKSNVC